MDILKKITKIEKSYFIYHFTMKIIYQNTLLQILNKNSIKTKIVYENMISVLFNNNKKINMLKS